MHSFSDIIAKWPSLTLFRKEVGVPLTTAQSWRDRDSIPNRYWPKLIEAAKGRHIRGVTPALLGSLQPGKTAKPQMPMQESA